MELLKVFVGDAALSSASATKNTMVKGDLLLLDATTHDVATGSSTSVVIAACNDKGIYVSAPITNANIKYLNYANSASVTPAETQSTVVMPQFSNAVAAGTTLTLGVQIKEDLRMGTYNKNTEILSSYVAPSSSTVTTTEVAASLAAGFSANPLSSSGSPYQLVKVERTCSTTPVGLGASVNVVKGAKGFTTSASVTLADGAVLSIAGGVYQIAPGGGGTGTSFILDTAYQGETATVATGTSSTTVGTITIASSSIWGFKFTGVAQTQKNRYDQFRMVDFVVITPKGNDAGFFTISKTGPTYPIGSYRQVRDLEEKAYTNSMPLINYREFPFETFPINADPTFTYDILTIGFTTNWGYNMMQSNQSEFLQTVVVAAPRVAQGQFDATVSPAIANNFAGIFNTWYTGTDPFGNIA